MDRNVTFVFLSLNYAAVAPRRGAWIEILHRDHLQLFFKVAPRRGAWIEILGFVTMNGVK